MKKPQTILIIGSQDDSSIKDLLLTSLSRIGVEVYEEQKPETGITPHFSLPDLLEVIDNFDTPRVLKNRKRVAISVKLASDVYFDNSLTLSEQSELRHKNRIKADMAQLVLQIISEAKERNEMNQIPLLHLVRRPLLPDHHTCWETVGNVMINNFSIERTHIIRPPPPFIGGFFIYITR